MSSRQLLVVRLAIRLGPSCAIRAFALTGLLPFYAAAHDKTSSVFISLRLQKFPAIPGLLYQRSSVTVSPSLWPRPTFNGLVRSHIHDADCFNDGSISYCTWSHRMSRVRGHFLDNGNGLFWKILREETVFFCFLFCIGLRSLFPAARRESFCERSLLRPTFAIPWCTSTVVGLYLRQI